MYAAGTEQHLQMLRQYQVQTAEQGKAFETATLALQEVNKSKQKKKQKQKPKKKSKTTETKTKEPKTKAATPLPVELKGMTFEHRSCVTMAAEIHKKRKSKKSESVEEKDAETEQPDQVVQVAKWITVRKGKPNENKYDLAQFDNSQLRQLAKNFGCKQCGSASMFVCRAEIAKRISMGHLYHTLFIPNSTATKVDLKINTLLRLVNTVCSPEFLDRFLLLNDTKKRKDLEESSGLSPLKVFWMDVSDYFNDAENNDILSVVLDPDDEHMADYLKEGTINLNEYNQLNHTVCAKHMRDMMRCRNKIRASLKVSGEHSNDPFTYLNSKHLDTKSVKTPGCPVYYLDKQCMKHTAIDSAFATVLDKHLRSCSMSTGNDVDEDDATSSLTKSTTRQDDFNVQFKEVTEGIFAAAEVANQQRQTLIQMQELSIKESQEESAWAEYVKLAETVSNLQEANQQQILKNIAKRVRAIEKKLQIDEEDSIVANVPA